MAVAIQKNRVNPVISALLRRLAAPSQRQQQSFPQAAKAPGGERCGASRANVKKRSGDLSLIKEFTGRPCSYFNMASLIYRCPFTGKNVQDWVAEDVSSGEVFVSLACLACTRTHLVNPATGRVLGANDPPDK